MEFYNPLFHAYFTSSGKGKLIIKLDGKNPGWYKTKCNVDPDAHDSATQYVSLSPIFQCQDTDIKTQLENGYRYLDIRLVIDGQDLILKHNFAKCKASNGFFSKPLTIDSVLKDIYAFLDEHPSETIIFCVKKENSKDNLDVLKQLLTNNLFNKLKSQSILIRFDFLLS